VGVFHENIMQDTMYLKIIIKKGTTAPYQAESSRREDHGDDVKRVAPIVKAV
jgi:hypothetical protein